MRLFVTGSTGFVGSHVVRELEDQGHDVIVMNRPGADASALAGRRCERVEGSLTNVDDLRHAMTDCDGVFHVAGNTSWFRRDAREVWTANVDSTRCVIEAMRLSGIKRGVLTSSISSVGFTDDPRAPADEDTPHNWPTGFTYPLSKRGAEDVAFASPDVNMVAVNPATVFGPGDHRMGIGVVFQKVSQRKFPRLKQGGFSMCDVRDVAKGHVLAFERGRRGQRYILGGANLDYGTVLEMIASAIGVKPPRGAVPPWLLRTLGRVAAFVEKLGGRMDTAAAHLWCMTRYLFHSTERAKLELGYAPRPFEDTLRDSVVWYRQQGMIS